MRTKSGGAMLKEAATRKDKKKKKTSRRNLDRANNNRNTVVVAAGSDRKKKNEEKKKNHKSQGLHLEQRGNREDTQVSYFPEELLEPVIHSLPLLDALRLSLVSRAFRDAARRWRQSPAPCHAPLLCVLRSPEGKMPTAFFSSILHVDDGDDGQAIAPWSQPPRTFQVKAMVPKIGNRRTHVWIIGSLGGWIFLHSWEQYTAWNPVSGRVCDLPRFKWPWDDSSETSSAGLQIEEEPEAVYIHFLKIIYMSSSPIESGCIIVAADATSDEVLIWEREENEYVDDDSDDVVCWTVLGSIPGASALKVVCALDDGGRRLLVLDIFGCAWAISLPPLDPCFAELESLSWADTAELGDDTYFACVPVAGTRSAYAVAYRVNPTSSTTEIVFVKLLVWDTEQSSVWNQVEGLLGGAIFIDHAAPGGFFVAAAEGAGCRPDSVYVWRKSDTSGDIVDVPTKRIVGRFAFSSSIVEHGKNRTYTATWLTPSLC